MIINKKFFFLIILNCILYCTALGQKKPEFSSAFKAGLLNGEADKAGAALQFVSSVAYKTWFSGIGAGIDYYSGFKSVPVFFDIQKDLKEKKNTPFLNADVGYNWPLINKDYKKNYGVKYKFQGGLYYEVSAGYKFVLNNSLSMAFSAGYSYKNFKEKDIAYYGIDPFGQPLPPHVDLYNYKFRRVSIKVAFGF